MNTNHTPTPTRRLGAARRLRRTAALMTAALVAVAAFGLPGSTAGAAAVGQDAGLRTSEGAVGARAQGALAVPGANRSVVVSWPRQRVKGLRISLRGHKIGRGGRVRAGWAKWGQAKRLRPKATRYVFKGLRNGREYQVKLDMRRSSKWRTVGSGVAVAHADGFGPSPSSPGTVSVAELERQVFDLTNVARNEGRICGSQFMPAAAPLQWDQNLATAARAHSTDMATRGYFAHDTPEGKTPWQRFGEAGVRPYQGAAENIAQGNRTPRDVVDGWINSPGHCRNLMGNYENLGVGLSSSATGSRYWTQDFIRPTD
ncbi:MAG: CAP domain-containing protein [Candidatus Nanopelagicales bacterium]|nr:CAP domain-containing protein [Candidatus Nanopelagicales bacterium]